MAKSQFSFDGSANLILSRLAKECLDGLGRHLEPLELEVKQVIYQPNTPVRHAYFVEDGMVSVVSIMEDGSSIEVGTIGKEGVVGAFLLLGAKSVPYQYFVQIAGHGLRIDAAKFEEAAEEHDEIREIILKYQSAFHTQAMQSAACNGLHSLTQRCCRWLLMSQDRVTSGKLHLTHEFLGLMLGVRRASVTDVLRPLQDRGWIESKRGQISILDRGGLESGTCECYRIITDQPKQLLE
jgi:CRP-like cAMP-binding protein